VTHETHKEHTPETHDEVNNLNELEAVRRKEQRYVPCGTAPCRATMLHDRAREETLQPALEAR
jgi:hypothetical protein